MRILALLRHIEHDQTEQADDRLPIASLHSFVCFAPFALHRASAALLFLVSKYGLRVGKAWT